MGGSERGGGGGAELTGRPLRSRETRLTDRSRRGRGEARRRTRGRLAAAATPQLSGFPVRRQILRARFCSSHRRTCVGSEEPWRHGLLRRFLAALRIHSVKARPCPAWREPRGSAPQKPGKGFSLPPSLRYATRKKNGWFRLQRYKDTQQDFGPSLGFCSPA